MSDQGRLSGFDVNRVSVLAKSNFGLLRQRARGDGTSIGGLVYADVPLSEPYTMPRCSQELKFEIKEGSRCVVDTATINNNSRGYARCSKRVRGYNYLTWVSIQEPLLKTLFEDNCACGIVGPAGSVGQ